MIRIVKPSGPAELLAAGAAATKQLCDDFDSDPLGYQTGRLAFPPFDSNIYAHESVKAALIADQRGKCAFCESRVTHVSYGDVEHFRPKRGVHQSKGQPLSKTGYYWLAYDWDNLFLACQLCNQRHKKNLFPLRVQRDRCRSHGDPISREKPVFIHPAAENPERFITFVGSSADPVRKSRRGRRTIDELGLNRPELVEARQFHLRQLADRRSTIDVLLSAMAQLPQDADIPVEIAKHRAALIGAQLPTADYSAMAKAFLS